MKEGRGKRGEREIKGAPERAREGSKREGDERDKREQEKQEKQERARERGTLGALALKGELAHA